MADTHSQIHEGDEVEWKWGTSHPNGVVAEIEEEGKLEIKTKGKLIHKNASPENPAVHVAREGNDVVKRMSELTKMGSCDGEDVSGGDEGGEKVAKDEEGEESDKGDDGQNDEKQMTKKQREVDNSAENGESGGEKEEIEQGKESTEVETGEKRKRQEPGEHEEGKSAEGTKKDNNGKKAKISGEAESSSSPKKGRQAKVSDKSKGKKTTGTAAKRGRTTRASATTEGDGNELMELGDEEKEVPHARN